MGLVVHTIAAVVGVIAFVFALAAIVIYMLDIRLPRRLVWILWCVPFCPVLVVACLVIFILTIDAGI